MSTPSPFFDVDPDRRFKYVGGDPSLDLVNTVDWTEAGLEDERLVTYDGLTRWAEGASVLTADAAAELRRRAAESPADAAEALAATRRLRGVLQRVFTAVAAGSPTPEILRELDVVLSPALGRLRVEAHGDGADGLGWGWRGWGETLECILWPVAWSAARLLTSAERARIHVCAGPRCGWVYVDRSRNGLRRWCQTGVCGAQAKARRHYARKRAVSGGGTA